MTPILLLNLGPLQVYHYLTPEEVLQKTNPYKIFWQDTQAMKAFGPFLTIADAMTHYTTIMSAGKLTPAVPDNLIYVDFKAKRRIK